MSRKTRNKQNVREESLDDSELAEDLEESVHRCVRYLLYSGQTNLPVKKSDVVKNVLPESKKSMGLIIMEVGKILDKLYGCQLVSFEEGTTTFFLVIEKQNPLVTDIDGNPSNARKILTTLVLTHIFMSNNCVNQGSMEAFLSSLQIDLDRKHDFFGNVNEFINTTLVKQKFLDVTIDKVTKKCTYAWGPRAEATVSKVDILEFVCKVYKSKRNLQPDSWENQFKEAQKQQLATKADDVTTGN